MSTKARVCRLGFVLPLVLSASILAQTPAGKTKVTIRGSGSDVTIEKSHAASAPAPALRNSFSQSLFPQTTSAPAVGVGVMGEVLRLKSAGADDSMALTYLRLHQSELPSVIASEDVQALRQAGVGKPFLVALSTLAAVDIGKTGEGYPVPEGYAPPPEQYGMAEVPYGGDSYAYGYPAYGGSGGMRRNNFFLRPRPRPPIARPPIVHPSPRPMMTTQGIRREIGS